MSHLIAAIDESMRPGQYLLCATVVSTADRANVRQSLRALLLPNQRRLHAKHESDGRNQALLKSVAGISGVTCHIAVGRQRRDGARDRGLRLLVAHLSEMGVREVILEQVDKGTTRADRLVMDALGLQWRHDAPAQEPLLWISDLVASAYGLRGPRRQAAAKLIATVLHDV